MKKNFLFYFLICGAIGWLMECFWTGLAALFFKGDKKLACQTSLWMFPIYGLAAFIKPVSSKIKNCNALIRGGVYACIIFLTEFITGTILKKFGACPWDYSEAKLQYHGVIRFDYLPVWFVVGLLYEKLLKKL